MSAFPPIATAIATGRAVATLAFCTSLVVRYPRGQPKDDRDVSLKDVDISDFLGGQIFAGFALHRCLFPLDENLVTVLGTDVLSGVRGDDGHRKGGTGFAIGWRGRSLSVWPIEQACAVGNVIKDRRNWMRVKLVVNALLPNRVDHTKVLVFENVGAAAWS